MCHNAIQTTPKPARRAPPPPLLTQLSRENTVGEEVRPPSSQKEGSSPSTPLSPTCTSKTRSLSDPNISSDSSESRQKARSSRSRSSSLEIDENFHRVLDQDDKKPIESSQASELGNAPLGIMPATLHITTFPLCTYVI